MGDRANIVVIQPHGPLAEGEQPPMIYLYTHWDGSDLARILKAALSRGKDRWDDPPYLTRIIFCQMIQGDVEGLTGFGISTELCDNERPLLYVDSNTQSVLIGDRAWPFAQYIASDEAIRFYDGDA